ncbi:hypothetical protein [Deinococcus apachensis]|uniref:hypothetical protein n=1 Tax=Deinococcus apachensis TaxID=309886 RepID=UPI000363BE1F|nr:hypothetical protein [Deinococcus apachensis]
MGDSSRRLCALLVALLLPGGSCGRGGPRIPPGSTGPASYELDTVYPACRPLKVPARVRYESLFRKMYGDSAREAAAHLDAVNWLG